MRFRRAVPNRRIIAPRSKCGVLTRIYAAIHSAESIISPNLVPFRKVADRFRFSVNQQPCRAAGFVGIADLFPVRYALPFFRRRRIREADQGFPECDVVVLRGHCNLFGQVPKSKRAAGSEGAQVDIQTDSTATAAGLGPRRESGALRGLDFQD